MPGGRKTSLRQAALAAELVENEGLSLRAAEARTGLDHATIHRVINGHKNWGEIVESPVFKRHRETQNKALEAAYRAGAAIGLQEAYKQKKLDKASHYQLVLASSIAIDKARLLAGESTQNIAVAHHIEVDDLNAAADRIAHSLLRFSGNTSIDVTPPRDDNSNVG